MRESLMLMALLAGPAGIAIGIYAILKRVYGWGCVQIGFGIALILWLMGNLIMMAGNQ